MDAINSSTEKIRTCFLKLHLINATCNGEISAISITNGMYQYAVICAPEIKNFTVDIKSLNIVTSSVFEIAVVPQ